MQAQQQEVQHQVTCACRCLDLEATLPSTFRQLPACRSAEPLVAPVKWNRAYDQRKSRLAIINLHRLRRTIRNATIWVAAGAD